MTTLWYPIIILISQIEKPRPERLSCPKSLELVSGNTKIQILSDRIQQLCSYTLFSTTLHTGPEGLRLHPI